jgi:DNA-nicking Smr family endonuclease
MSRRRLSDEERALWTGVARSIKPLRSAKPTAEPLRRSGGEHTDQAAPDGVRPGARSSPQLPARREPLSAVKSPPLAPLDRRAKQRVARGRDAIDARIDLHGMTQRQAHAALLGFLRRAQAERARVVLVVTGKGGGTAAPERGERGVLRRQVPMWLELPEFRHFIVGFGEAHASHGGQGALYVRLRRAQ